MWAGRRNVALEASDLDVQSVEIINTGHFYRVQHSTSATEYHPPPSDVRFSPKYPFEGDRDLTSKRIMRHLEWDNHTEPGSSFVSVFDNYYDAVKRALHFYNRREKNIAIFVIHASGLVKRQLRQEDGTHIPVWTNSLNSEQMWLRMSEIGPILGIDYCYVQKSEWLACGPIHEERILTGYAFPLIGNRIHFSMNESKGLHDHLNELRGDKSYGVLPYWLDRQHAFDFKRQRWALGRNLRKRAMGEVRSFTRAEINPGERIIDHSPIHSGPDSPGEDNNRRPENLRPENQGPENIRPVDLKLDNQGPEKSGPIMSKSARARARKRELKSIAAKSGGSNSGAVNTSTANMLAGNQGSDKSAPGNSGASISRSAKARARKRELKSIAAKSGGSNSGTVITSTANMLAGNQGSDKSAPGNSGASISRSAKARARKRERKLIAARSEFPKTKADNAEVVKRVTADMLPAWDGYEGAEEFWGSREAFDAGGYVCQARPYGGYAF